MDQITLASFVEGHVLVSSAKLFLIMTFGFREKDVFSFLNRCIREACHALP